MSRKAKRIDPIDQTLLGLVRDGLVSKQLADKITLRILGDRAPVAPAPLAPDEIRALRERLNMSQAVFARYLNITTGHLSQLERGIKRPSGPALRLLHVIASKGIEAVL